MSLPAQESDGPVLFAELMDRGTDNLQREVERYLSSEASKAAHTATSWVCGLIRKAYASGVSDGYAQGVQAQATREYMDKSDGS